MGLRAHLGVRRIVSFTRALKSCPELPAGGSWELNNSLNTLAAA